jgi:FixJ family two-component response regulator
MTPSTPTERTATEPKRSILLVEDDDAVRRSLQLLLSGRGHDVRAYPSALSLARDSAALRCDCLIADLMMPPSDAITLLGELRSAGWLGPAILISGFLDNEWQALALRAGFHAVLSKPMSDSLLVRTVEALPA